MKALDAYLADYVKDIVDPSGGLSGGGSGGSGAAGTPLRLTAFEGNNPGYYSGNLGNVVDGNTGTTLWYNDYARVGQFIGVDLGRTVLVGKVTFTQDSGDHFSDYTLQYSTDGVTYHDYKDYKDTVLEVDLAGTGIEARYLRFYNNAVTSVWIKICEIAVTEAAATTIETNNETAASWTTRVGNESAELLTGGEATFAPGEYVGFDLRRIKELNTITVSNQGALTLQVSVNNVDWVNVEAGEQTENGRYVRLINLTDANQSVNLTTFTVTATVYTGPYLLETDIGINSSWGVSEDSRDNGAAFDGNIGTTTEFGDFVAKGQYFIYDLGMTRDIWKLEIYCADNAVNYIRDAEMQISNDLENWTTVLTIGDGIQNTGEASVTCINSDAGYSQATSSYPNFVSIEGEIEAQTARYIRVIMTAANTERAVLFNEIEINDGEYVSLSNDPTFEVSVIEVQGHVPQNMTDGDLTTSWKPDTTEAGSMVYTFSDNLTLNHINIVQKAVSNARVYLYAENGGSRSWIDMGVLDKSLVTLVCQNDLNLALKIEWNADSIPNITEIVRYDAEIPCMHEYGEYVSNNNATCESDSTKTAVCTLCGAKHTIVEEGTALGHEWGDWTQVEAPTVFEDGLEERTCGRCGKTEQNAIPMLGNPFVDVNENDYCYAPVMWALKKGITTGTSANHFSPADKCNRGQTVTFLWRAAGSPEPITTVNPFVDVPAGSYCEKAVLWAYEKGITTGTDATHFAPELECNRAQIITFLYRAAGYPEIQDRSDPVFTDLDYEAFYMDAILWALENHITNGVNDTEFGVAQICNRAQAVTFLYRMYGE